MAIPNIPVFEEFLSTITQIDPKNSEFSKIEIPQELFSLNPDGGFTKNTPICIWYNNNVSLKVDSIIQKIQIELKLINHFSNEEVVKAILLIFTYFKSQNCVDVLNNILALNTSSEISQFHIFRLTSKESITPVSFGEFYIDNLPSERMRYKCEKAESDYFTLYEEEIGQKPSIERKRFNTVVINCHELSIKAKSTSLIPFEDACRLYFESISKVLFEKFWANFSEQQDLHISAGYQVIQEKTFKEMLGSESVTIFNKITANGKNRGFVVPFQIGNFNINFSRNLGPALNDFYLKLKNEFLFTFFEDNEVNQTFKTYCKFIAKGYRYLEELKIDDAFLHFVIAIDLVYGDINESTKTIITRCATLTFLKFDKDYAKHKSTIGKLYDARSRYVHQGQSVKEGHVETIKKLCTELLHCFFRINRYMITSKIQMSIIQWKKKIDYASSALEAGEIIGSTLKLEIGIET